MPQEHPLPSYERLVTEVVEGLRTAAGVPLVVIAGPAGFEVSHTHDEICLRRQSDQDTPGTTLTISLDGSLTKLHLLDLFPAQSVLRGKQVSTISLKDVQSLRPDALQPFEALVRQLPATKTVCVASLALPVPPESRQGLGLLFDRLRRDGLLRYVTLRPLPRSKYESEYTTALGATPEQALVERSWSVNRGWPATIAKSIRIADENDMVCKVDRHVFHTPWHGYPRLTETDEVVHWIRRKGALLWSAAKAVAVLDPLGPALPHLLAKAMNVTEPRAAELLTTLQQIGVLCYHRVDGTWRFRLPLVGATLRAVLGPFERRRLAKIAVDALWAGTAYSAYPGYLPDQLAYAGRMVDPERARQELLANAGRLTLADADQAIAWLRAAAEVTSDRGDRAAILLTHAQMCLAHGLPRFALESSSTLLNTYLDDITPNNLVDVYLVHVGALFDSKDLDMLEKIAQGSWWPWPGGPLERGITRAFTQALLGRWRETHDLLHIVRQEPGAEEFHDIITMIGPSADLFLGLTAEFDEVVATLPARVGRGQRPIAELVSHSRALLALGELDRVEELLTRTREVEVNLGAPAKMAMAFYRGEFDESLNLARKNIATGPPHGCDANQSVMFQLAAMLQLSRGKLTRSRELLATARSRRAALPHVLAVPEAALEMMFLEYERARSLLLTAVGQAEDEGVVAQTDCLWITIATIAIHDGTGRDQLPECLHRLEKIAAQIGTGPAEIHRLSVQALVNSDEHAAESALALLRRRGQPFEQATGIERLVRFGLVEPSLLVEAYEHYGAADALLRRAWLRLLMQQHGVAVPGRQVTVAENERLLAVLVSEGLSNKQIAQLLHSSDKSVEGRLSRLFSRTGYQSRVELAAAMLTGQFELST
ncbi:hypothetical protein [Amycolatopsis sp. NPDC059657]|uniref:helix-turn-helix transcriptional regulator n=1 Tax=Amycolatopsis sp. NPDC059657 TaxID=3346899 RepID=UPI0036701E0B